MTNASQLLRFDLETQRAAVKHGVAWTLPGAEGAGCFQEAFSHRWSGKRAYCNVIKEMCFSG